MISILSNREQDLISFIHIIEFSVVLIRLLTALGHSGEGLEDGQEVGTVDLEISEAR